MKKKKKNPIIEFPKELIKDNEIIEPMNRNLKQNKELKPYYYISDDGNLYSTSGKNKFMQLKLYKNDGYFQTRLYNTDGTASTLKVHRMVISTFDPHEDMYKKYINHKDGIKTNNNINNLEWCTAKENVQHAFETGLHKHTVTDDKLVHIFDLLNSGYSIDETAELTGYSRQTILDAKTGQLHFKERIEQLEIDPIYNKHRKLTDDEIREIIRLAKEGYSDKYIADRIGCKPYTVKDARLGGHNMAKRLQILGLDIVSKN